MPKFSTDESVSLERELDSPVIPVETEPDDIDDTYEIRKCVDWIKSNNFKKVCLQFPNYMLPDSTEVVLRLQKILKRPLYLVGDSAFESCCIDYLSAKHIDGDAIIHFGPICFSRTSANIPYLNIYEKKHLNVKHLKRSCVETFPCHHDEITILVDSPYIHHLGDISAIFSNWKNAVVQPIDEDPLVIATKIIVFVGNHERKLINLEYSFQPKLLYYFDVDLKKYDVDPVVLKRRNYMIEQVKDSTTIGIVIGTLCVKNYLQIMDRLKQLIALNGKKFYLISVGKPSASKLSNFIEIDVYVLITCSLSEIFDSRDFYKPIVTPFDVEIALNPNRNPNAKFSYDYNTYLSEDYDLQDIEVNEMEEGDVSLLTNAMRVPKQRKKVSEDALKKLNDELAVKGEGTVSLNSKYGAGFLITRSWKGLEQDLGRTEAEVAQEGRSGIAQKYDNEGGDDVANQ